MKILIITGPLWPNIGNNANLFGKLVPFLSKHHEIRILSAVDTKVPRNLPSTAFGIPVEWVFLSDSPELQRLLTGLRSRLTDGAGRSGYAGGVLLAKAVRSYRAIFPFELVISTMQPYIAVCATALLKELPRILYLMDPPDFTIPEAPTKSVQSKLLWAMQKQNVILTTPFIQEKLNNKASLSDIRIESVQFPHIQEHISVPAEDDIPMDPGKINLLYCGALFPEIRDPSCFLKIISSLDERFAVHIMGRGCTAFWKRYQLATRASVFVYDPRSYQAACNAMEHADFLINLGNNMHVHMPSKTLEYINTGKPIIHFYKFPDCPTLQYMSRYPLSLLLPESDFDLVRDADRVVSFCLSQKGSRVERETIEQLYSDCTPSYIADKLLSEIRNLSKQEPI